MKLFVSTTSLLTAVGLVVDAGTTGPTIAPAMIPPTPPTLCEKYATAVFGDASAENELALMTAVVNLSVVGDQQLGVPGILAPEGGLAPFFSGAGPFTNRGGSAVTIDFLDGASDINNPTGNTQVLLVHLYQFFGALLGCTAAGFPIYSGSPDMFEVHRFMGITKSMNDFFIEQVGAAALALGVTSEDVATIANVLDSVFNTRCPPLVGPDDGLPSFMIDTNPSICQASSCPLDKNSPCLQTPMPTASPTPMPTASPTSMPTSSPTQRPVTAVPASEEADTLCEKYSKAVFGDDTAENELALMTAVVNLAVVGDASLGVAGILAAEGGLAPFFSGAGPFTNRGGDEGVAVNFLDGAADIDNPTGNTQVLLVHLYQFFGALLGCRTAGFPTYTGNGDMFEVHKFMGITQAMNDFFIDQVALSASALGVVASDVLVIEGVLDGVFNTRCPPLVEAEDGLPDFMVGTNPSICQASSCPLAANSPCATPPNGEQDPPAASRAFDSSLFFAIGAVFAATALHS